MLIGQTLQSARRAQGMTLTALAAASGVHFSTLSRWERGKATPFTDELTRVMGALNLSDEARRACFQSVEVPRTIQIARADPGAAKVPISTGELLRALRNRAGVTQTDAARDVGVSQGLITQWEKGSSLPTDAHLHKLCFAYRVTDEEMVFLTTRGWRDIDPLPMDKDALDGVVDYLGYHDSTPHRHGAYLIPASTTDVDRSSAVKMIA